MTRWLKSLIPLPFLLALGAWASAQAADRAASAGVSLLVLVAPLVHDVPARPAEPFDAVIPTELSLVPLAAGESVLPAGVLAGPTGKPAKRHAASHATAPPVVFVSGDQVLHLASARVQPHGVPVAANGSRPAGLRLSGVTALGVGLRDGDVLTRAVGQPALSSGAVVQAVLLARARHASVLEGEFWRGNERWLLRVEQPYVSLDLTPG